MLQALGQRQQTMQEPAQTAPQPHAALLADVPTNPQQIRRPATSAPQSLRQIRHAVNRACLPSSLQRCAARSLTAVCDEGAQPCTSDCDQRMPTGSQHHLGVRSCHSQDIQQAECRQVQPAEGRSQQDSTAGSAAAVTSVSSRQQTIDDAECQASEASVAVEGRGANAETGTEAKQCLHSEGKVSSRAPRCPARPLSAPVLAAMQVKLHATCASQSQPLQEQHYPQQVKQNMQRSPDAHSMQEQLPAIVSEVSGSSAASLPTRVSAHCLAFQSAQDGSSCCSMPVPNLAGLVNLCVVKHSNSEQHRTMQHSSLVAADRGAARRQRPASAGHADATIRERCRSKFEALKARREAARQQAEVLSAQLSWF